MEAEEAESKWVEVEKEERPISVETPLTGMYKSKWAS